MKRRNIAIAILTLALGAGVASASDPVKDADNTARNVRDRNDATIDPLDQGGSEADRNITAEIRKAVVADDSLSMNAHNVKIITRDGVVTLRGPVKSSEEKMAVASAAAKIAGVKKVDDQLEVERNP